MRRCLNKPDILKKGGRAKGEGAGVMARIFCFPAVRLCRGSDHTGSAIEYFTWLNAKLDSIEAMPSSRVSLFFKNAS